MGSRDHSIECEVCGNSYGGFNGPEWCEDCEGIDDQALALRLERSAKRRRECSVCAPWDQCNCNAWMYWAATNLAIAGGLQLAYSAGLRFSLCRDDDDWHPSDPEPHPRFR